MVEKFPSNIFESTESTAYFNRLVDSVQTLQTKIKILEENFKRMEIELQMEKIINKDLSSALSTFLFDAQQRKSKRASTNQKINDIV
jgi:uncharacterized protein YdcH (DUF465 family)